MSAINFIPNDQQAVENMEAVDIAEQLLRMTQQLKNFGLDIEALEIGKIIDGWLLRTIPHTAAGELGAQAIIALTGKLQVTLPATVGYTANYRAGVIAQLNLHLQHVRAGRLDIMCYAEHYAENTTIAALGANVTSIIQSL